jgi:hypothetical protein
MNRFSDVCHLILNINCEETTYQIDQHIEGYPSFNPLDLIWLISVSVNTDGSIILDARSMTQYPKIIEIQSY